MTSTAAVPASDIVGDESGPLPLGKSAVFTGQLVVVVILVGIAAGWRWPDPDGNYYAAVAGVISAMFLAIVVDGHLLTDSALLHRRVHRAVLPVLLSSGVTGLVSCVRGLTVADEEPPQAGPLAGWVSPTTVHALMSGAAAAGLMASLVLALLVLFERPGSRRLLSVDLVVPAIFLPPVLVLLLLP